jgi:WD40 repeat protein
LSTAVVWDARSGAKRFDLRHDGPLTWVAYHPKGDRIATAAEDKMLRMWLAADGKHLDRLLPQGGSSSTWRSRRTARGC